MIMLLPGYPRKFELSLTTSRDRLTFVLFGDCSPPADFGAVRGLCDMHRLQNIIEKFAKWCPSKVSNKHYH